MMGLPKGHFTHIFLDEAGQAAEPEVMSVLDKYSGQVVLAGDPMQLGPIVLWQIATEYRLCLMCETSWASPNPKALIHVWSRNFCTTTILYRRYETLLAQNPGFSMRYPPFCPKLKMAGYLGLFSMAWRGRITRRLARHVGIIYTKRPKFSTTSTSSIG